MKFVSMYTNQYITFHDYFTNCGATGLVIYTPTICYVDIYAALCGDSNTNNDRPSTQGEFVLESIITKVSHGTDRAGCPYLVVTNTSINLLLCPELIMRTTSTIKLL